MILSQNHLSSLPIILSLAAYAPRITASVIVMREVNWLFSSQTKRSSTACCESCWRRGPVLPLVRSLCWATWSSRLGRRTRRGWATQWRWQWRGSTRQASVRTPTPPRPPPPPPRPHTPQLHTPPQLPDCPPRPNPRLQLHTNCSVSNLFIGPGRIKLLVWNTDTIFFK